MKTAAADNGIQFSTDLLPAGPVLFYGTGGLAYGNVDTSSAINGAGAPLGAQTNDLRVGWVGAAASNTSIRRM